MKPNITDNLPTPHRISRIQQDAGLDAATVAVRRLMDSFVRLGDDTDLDLDVMVKELHALSDRIDAHAPAEEDRMVQMWAGEHSTQHDPVTGFHNPIAPPLEFHGLADGSVEAIVTLGIVYQGQPRMAHGGIAALLIDHAYGVANGWAGLSGMTAHLELDYRRPTPLFEPLTIRARQIRVEGRKIWTEGTLSAGGEVCVSSEALFIAGHLPRPR